MKREQTGSVRKKGRRWWKQVEKQYDVDVGVTHLGSSCHYNALLGEGCMDNFQ